MTRDYEVYNKDDGVFHDSGRGHFFEVFERHPTSATDHDCHVCHEIVASLNFVKALERKFKIELLNGMQTKQEEFDKLLERLFDEEGRRKHDAPEPRR